MKLPLAPPSSAAPASALSTQCAMKIVRTPICFSRAMPRSMSARSQFGCPCDSLQPNGLDVSIPIITASRPRLIALAAARGPYQSRNPPPAPPGPPTGPPPPAPAPAALRVDVVLQRLQLPHLGLDALGLVARVGLARLDLAERLVLDRLRDDEP